MGAMLKVDLAARFLPPDHNVFVLHPGAKKRFYADFTMQDCVFLDIPGISLPATIDKDAPELTQLLAVSENVIRWRRNGAEPNEAPSRNIADYERYKLAVARRRLLSEVDGLYRKARKGDLVICPGEGYMSGVLIGEFAGDFEPNVFGRARIYGDEDIPARKVKWLTTSRRKAFFSDRLIQLMQNQAALIQITNEHEKNEVYEAAYKDFSVGGESVGRILITKEHIDLFDLTESNRLIFYFSSMYKAIDDGKLEEFLELDMTSAISAFYDPALFIDTHISINSPGDIALRAKKATLPAFLGVMIALSGMCVSPTEAAAADVGNSVAAPTDTCTIEVATRVKTSLEMMHADLWQKICQERKRSEASVGLASPVKIVRQAPPPVPASTAQNAQVEN